VLKGTTLRSDDDDNRLIYGRAVKHEDILQGRIAAPVISNPLLVMLNGYSSVEDKPTAETSKSR
jgi:lipid-binding SYLF domain-containing protein